LPVPNEETSDASCAAAKPAVPGRRDLDGQGVDPDGSDRDEPKAAPEQPDGQELEAVEPACLEPADASAFAAGARACQAGVAPPAALSAVQREPDAHPAAPAMAGVAAAEGRRERALFLSGLRDVAPPELAPAAEFQVR
jgi:hypothetical protein